MLRVGRELTGHHSIAGVSGVPAPLLVQNGWTDDLFPAPEALRVWRMFRGVKGARVTLQLGDLGHPRGRQQAGRRPGLQRPGRQVLRRLPQGQGQAAAPRRGDRLHADLPRGGPGGRALPGEQLGEAAPRHRAARRPRRPAGDLVGRRPRHLAGDQPDRRQAALRAAARAHARTAPRSRSAAWASRSRCSASPPSGPHIRTKGRAGFIAGAPVGRLAPASRRWSRVASTGSRTTRRARSSSSCSATAGATPSGHTAKLELTGSDSSFLRTSNFDFSVKVSKLTVALPTHEK